MMRYNGKVLGVLGGMGPAAAAEFLRVLTERAVAQTDQEHPVVYLMGDTSLPDRSAAMLGMGKSPEAQLRADFQKLSDWGADILCAPCNSAHYFIDRFRHTLSRPLVHIIESTLEAARAKSPNGAWLIGTEGTLRSGLYQQHAARSEYTLHMPDEDAFLDTQVALRQIKANDFVAAGEAMKRVAERLWAVADLPIMLACTELPLAYQAAELPESRSVSSLAALADACLSQLYEEVE